MAKRPKRKKAASAKSKRGAAAVTKGKTFEDKVADLYRLLGAEVTQNIEICQKKVDLLAVFPLPGGSIPHRVIVECKDEKRVVAQNQRVMQFTGLLDTTRKAGEADSAAIITRVAWGDQAKGFALKAGIELLTYDQKLAQLIDFTPYLKGLVERYRTQCPDRPDDPPLGAYYVEPAASRKTGKGEQTVHLHRHIRQWVKRKSKTQLAVLGEYGTGKTSLCESIAAEQAEACLKQPGKARIPLVFNLRDFTKTLAIEPLVTAFLDQQCGVANPRFKVFEAMNGAGIFFLIFDGLDEMAVRVDADTIDINLHEIEKLACDPNSKVLLSSRIEYFISGREQSMALRPKGNVLATRHVEYRPVTIKPWDDARIDDFLQRRIPLVPSMKRKWTCYRGKIHGIPGLSDLASRPVLLDMIVRTLPTLIARRQSIDRPNLYQTYLLQELKRQTVVKRRGLLLPPEKRLSALKQLAMESYGPEATVLTFDSALAHVDKHVKPAKAEREAYTRDSLSCSFLVRKGDTYTFSHRSILEYLTAVGLADEIKSDSPKLFSEHPIDAVVAGFLRDLKPDKRRLWKWVRSTRGKRESDVRFLGGNAVTVLCMLDRNAVAHRDLSDTVLLGPRFVGADLAGTRLRRALLDGADLSFARYTMATIRGATMSDCVLTCWLTLELTQKKRFRDFVNEVGTAVQSADAAFSSISCYVVDLPHMHEFLLGLATLTKVSGKAFTVLHDALRSLQGVESVGIYDDEIRAIRQQVPDGSFDDVYAEERR